MIHTRRFFGTFLTLMLGCCGYIHAASVSWSNGSPMSAPRGGHCATVLTDGRVLVTGGEVGNNAIAQAVIYDPASNSWSSAGSLHTARFWHTATLLTNGEVLVAGGLYFNANNPVHVSESEIYDPASNTWTTTGAMNVGRSSHTATLLPSGKVLVAGGVASYGATATAEIFDPVSMNWTYANALPEARFAHTATLLSSGGSGVSGQSISAACTVTGGTVTINPTSATTSSNGSATFSVTLSGVINPTYTGSCLFTGPSNLQAKLVINGNTCSNSGFSPPGP